MPVPVTVPRLGWSMDEGTFIEWLKRDGDAVRPGDALFLLENEKAAESIEAMDAGTLHIAADGPQPGEVVRVGRLLGYLLAEGEAVPAPPPAAGGAAEVIPSSRGASDANLAGRTAPAAKGDRVAITPRARRAARELGIDPASLQGSGRGGRIRERDVRGAAAGAAGRFIPHTHVRRLTAARMVAGVTQAAPVTLTTWADAAALVALRRRLREAAEPAPSYTDIVMHLTAAALRRHPLLQAQWRDDGLLLPDAVHVAVAVDTDAGLFAPVIRDADRLSLAEVAVRSRELVALARAGQLGADAMRDATFTVTNLGMFGVDAFTPVIHLPQCAVLGLGRIVREPAVVGDRVVPRERMTLSLTFDHRIVDGAPAARFLDDVRQAIEGCEAEAP